MVTLQLNSLYKQSFNCTFDFLLIICSIVIFSSSAFGTISVLWYIYLVLNMQIKYSLDKDPWRLLD